MTSYINYFIEVNCCLVVVGLMYWLLLKNDSDIKFRRIFILSGVIISLIAPLFQLNSMSFIESSSLSNIPTTILPELVIGEQNNDSKMPIDTINSYIPIAYMVISLILLQVFLFQLMQVAWFTLSRKTQIRKEGYFYIIETNGTLPTFSFFNLLFFDNSIPLSKTEKAKVMYHEIIHIKELHSLDVIILEMSKILMWINPIAWYLRKEIQDVHEYLADEKVIKNTEAQQYKSLLAKMALSKAHLAIGHHFNKSKTLKRINMMNQVKSKVKTWKPLLAFPLMALIIFIVSCNDQVMDDIDTAMETASQVEMPAVMNETFNSLEKRYPDADFTYIEVEGTSKDAINRLQDVDPNSIAHIRPFKSENKLGVIINRNGPISQLTPADGVFTIVEESAMPPGGYKAFYQRMASTLKYPAQAKKEGVEGKVYVQFIVDKTGKLTEYKVVKGIGAGCDAAAVAALEQLDETWSAPTQRGKAVKQRIILPITFKLGDTNEAEG